MAINILDLYETKPKPREYVLPGLLPGRIGSIVSPGGTGKSMFAIQLCHLVAGFDSLDFGEYPLGKAIYLSSEDAEDVLHERFFALGRIMSPMDRGMCADNIILEDFTMRAPNLLEKFWLDEIETYCTDARILFLDTLRSFHLGDENCGGQMSQIMGNLRAIAAKTQCAIVFLHHANKNAAATGNGDSQQASRGSSVLTDNIRWQAYLLSMTKEESARLSLEHGVAIGHDGRKLFVKFGLSKQNYGAPLDEKWFMRGEGGILKAVELLEIDNKERKGKDEKRKTSRNSGRSHDV